MECSSLSDIKPLKNWNISKEAKIYLMFKNCSSLLDIKALDNWSISKETLLNDIY